MAPTKNTILMMMKSHGGADFSIATEGGPVGVR